MVIAAAPSSDEILDVARLASDVAPASAIPHGHDRRERAPQPLDRRGLADPRIGARRVGEHDDLEGAVPADSLQRLGHGLERRGGARRILVVDRHDQRGPRLEARSRVGPGITALRGARDHRSCGKGDPCERHAEEEDHHPLQHGHAGEAHDLQHLIDAVGGDAEGCGKEDEAGEPDGRRGRRHRQARRRIVEILRGHAEAFLGRHAARALRRLEAHRGAQGAVHR